MSKKQKATIAPKNYKIVNKLQSQPKKGNTSNQLKINLIKNCHQSRENLEKKC